MTDATEQRRPPPLSLQHALGDFGWLPTILAVLVAGPSVLSILQSVFVEHRLSPILQWVVDSYNVAMSVLGAIVEPAVHDIAALLNLAFELDPIWRASFALLMVMTISVSRTLWREGAPLGALRHLVIVGVGALLAALCVGTWPDFSGELPGARVALQGLAALILVLVMDLFSSVDELIAESRYEEYLRRDGDFVYRKDGRMVSIGVFRRAARKAPWVLKRILLAFAAGTIAALVWPNIHMPALLGMGAVFVAHGLWSLEGGLRNNYLSASRFGLTVLGGFFVALLVLLADLALKTMQ